MIKKICFILCFCLSISSIGFGHVGIIHGKGNESFPNIKKVGREFISIFKTDPVKRSFSSVKNVLIKGFFSGSKKLLKKPGAAMPPDDYEQLIKYLKRMRTGDSFHGGG